MGKYEKERVRLANADYEDGKPSGVYRNVRECERFWKVKAGSLVAFRGNLHRRVDSGVSLFDSSAGPTNFNRKSNPI